MCVYVYVCISLLHSLEYLLHKSMDLNLPFYSYFLEPFLAHMGSINLVK